MNEDKILRVVSVFDPAIDHERTSDATLTEYLKSRDYDQIKGCMKPGEKPQVYLLKPIPHRLFARHVQASQTESERCLCAFECALHGIENFRKEDGTRVYWQPPNRVNPDAVGLTEEEFELFSQHEIEEVGAVAWFRHFLPRWTVGGYRLPPTCLAVLTQSLPRRVVVSPADAPKSSGEPSDSTQGTPNEADATGG